MPSATLPELAPDAPAAVVRPVRAAAVTRRYGDGDAATDALRGVSLDVDAGAFLAIMGPSGSGKSTLLHLLAGLDRPTSGTVVLAGADVGSLSDKQLTALRRRAVGFVFQQFHLLPTLTVAENVALALELEGGRRRDHAARVAELLDAVGLADRAAHRPAELSGGQQQRVAIARALAHRPEVLFADEPTGALDSAAGHAVLDLLREAADRDGQTIVMVTHDPRAAAVADRTVLLADGRVVGDLDAPSEREVLAALAEVSR